MLSHIPTKSMEPTLHGEDAHPDFILVDKTAYLPRLPRRWEVAVFHCPADLTKPYVKRVAGLPT